MSIKKKGYPVKYNSILKLLLSLIMVFVANTASQAFTLQEYIQKQCPKHCVKADVLVDTIHRAATSFRIDPSILLAIVEVESSFSTTARNNGSLGIAQINVRYHREKFFGKNYFDVEQNIFAGAKILKGCLTKHKGSYPRALSCYNGAPIKSNVYSNKVYKTLKKQSVIKKGEPKDHLEDFLIKKDLVSSLKNHVT